MDIASEKSNYQICILLGIWGHKYISAFLRISLPSLLAPGNIPALTNAYRTKFIFLTRSSDIKELENHPALGHLKKICEIEYIFIDDLIVFGNYSTTLTLAYDRAIKSTKDLMLKSYFVFLTSDYVMADGSLEGLLRYIKQGYSGICTGNFQVIGKEMEAILLPKINPINHVLQIQPRVLLKYSFLHLHPIVFTSFCNQKAVINYHINRFFLPYDEDTLVGRFFLLHMLCIKPETINYQIGSSCDYSFIPEMCPSGNIAIINDSDDYLVIEMQSKEHEQGNILWEQPTIDNYVRALQEWTTEQHRRNVTDSIYFHVKSLSAQEKQRIDQQISYFINDLIQSLSKYVPQPYREHPYWIGAINAFKKQKSALHNHKDYEFIDITKFISTVHPIKKIYHYLFGQQPFVYLWHHRWHEYYTVMTTLQNIIKQTKTKKIIALYDSYSLETVIYYRLLKTLDISGHYYLKNLIIAEKLTELQNGQFDTCILLFSFNHIEDCKLYLSIARKMIKQNGHILVMIPNPKVQLQNYIYNFTKELSYKINHILCPDLSLINVYNLHINQAIFLGNSIINRFKKLMSGKLKKIISFLYLPIFLLPIASFIINLWSKVWKSGSGHCSNIILMFSPAKITNSTNSVKKLD